MGVDAEGTDGDVEGGEGGEAGEAGDSDTDMVEALVLDAVRWCCCWFCWFC